jgi:cation diffusion facilitator CzcD-associated flavoprotein CzcO
VYYKEDCNRTAYDFWQKKTAAKIKDPKKRAILAPKEPLHTFGTVRPSLESGYYTALNQDNVEVVYCKDTPIERFTEKGIQTKDGKEREFDLIVLATGFDTHTGGFKQIDIRGENGLPLTEKWAKGCNSYLGLTTQGFPNLFFLYGPHGPTAYTNGPSTVEVQTHWVVKMIEHMRQEKIRYFEPDGQAEKDFSKRVDDLSAETLFHNSHGWYMGRNVAGKPVQALNYTGGLPSYIKDIEACSDNNYQGFNLVK